MKLLMYIATSVIAISNYESLYGQGVIKRYDHSIGIEALKEDVGERGTIDAIYLPLPAYPTGLMGANVGGTVSLHFLVMADGTVTQIKVLESRIPDFAKPCKDALRHWKFKPPVDVETRKPCNRWASCKIIFRMADE